MRLSTKCLFCGGVPSKREEGPVFIAWAENCVSVLGTLLFELAESREDVKRILRAGSYCESCVLRLRDLSLAHRMVTKLRTQMACLVEGIVQDVSSHVAKVSGNGLSKNGNLEEAVVSLYRGLEEEEWTEQTFDYIESAVLKSFVSAMNNMPFFIGSNSPGVKEDNDDEHVTVKEEAEDYSDELMLHEDAFGEGLMAFPEDTTLDRFQGLLLEEDVATDTPIIEGVVEKEEISGMGEVENRQSDCDDDDYIPHESDESYDEDDASERKSKETDEDYVPSSKKRRDTRSTGIAAAATSKRKVRDISDPSTTFKELLLKTVSKKLTKKKCIGNTTKTEINSEVESDSESSSKNMEPLPPRRNKKITKQLIKQMKRDVDFPVKCRHEKCTWQFRSEIRMEGHYNRLHLGDRERPHKCKFCKEEGSIVAGFKDYRELRMHIRRIHKTILSCDENKTFECPHPGCGRLMGSNAEVDAHVLAKHAEKPGGVPCEVCRKDFPTAEEMEVHKAKFHQGNYPFTCEDCDKIFDSAVALRKHVRQLHSTTKHLLCSVCKDKSFPSTQRLRYHNYLVHPELIGKEPFNCKLCNMTFQNYYFFRSHKVKVHPDQLKASRFKCPKCQKTFKQSGSLLSHQCQVKNPDESKYKCPICQKSFKNLTSLKYHEGTHSGVKHICFICGVQLSSQNHLRRHLNKLHPEEVGAEPVPKKKRGRKPKNHNLDEVDLEGHHDKVISPVLNQNCP